MAGRMRLGLHLEGAPGAVLAREGGVDGEVHAGIEEEGVDAGLGDPVGVAGQVGRGEGPGDPAEVLPVDAVAGEGPADQLDDRHAPVAQPAVHVLAAPRARPYRADRTGLAASRRTAQVVRSGGGG